MGAMGACFPKSPTCGEVNPNTKLFNVCCGGQVIIEHSEVDGNSEGEEPCYTIAHRKTKCEDKNASSLPVL